MSTKLFGRIEEAYSAGACCLRIGPRRDWLAILKVGFIFVLIGIGLCKMAGLQQGSASFIFLVATLVGAFVISAGRELGTSYEIEVKDGVLKRTWSFLFIRRSRSFQASEIKHLRVSSAHGEGTLEYPSIVFDYQGKVVFLTPMLLRQEAEALMQGSLRALTDK